MVELVKEGKKKERRETKLNESGMNDARQDQREGWIDRTSLSLILTELLSKFSNTRGRNRTPLTTIRVREIEVSKGIHSAKQILQLAFLSSFSHSRRAVHFHIHILPITLETFRFFLLKRGFLSSCRVKKKILSCFPDVACFRTRTNEKIEEQRGKERRKKI